MLPTMAANDSYRFRQAVGGPQPSTVSELNKSSAQGHEIGSICFGPDRRSIRLPGAIRNEHCHQYSYWRPVSIGNDGRKPDGIFSDWFPDDPFNRTISASSTLATIPGCRIPWWIHNLLQL